MIELFEPLNEAFRHRRARLRAAAGPQPGARRLGGLPRAGETARPLKSLENGAAGDWLRDVHLGLLEAEISPLERRRPGLAAARRPEGPHAEARASSGPWMTSCAPEGGTWTAGSRPASR